MPVHPWLNKYKKPVAWEEGAFVQGDDGKEYEVIKSRSWDFPTSFQVKYGNHVLLVSKKDLQDREALTARVINAIDSTPETASRIVTAIFSI